MTEFRKVSEVADFDLDGRPVLKMREGEDTHSFASRLVDSLYGENDLPKPPHKIPTPGCKCEKCTIWNAGHDGKELLAVPKTNKTATQS